MVKMLMKELFHREVRYLPRNPLFLLPIWYVHQNLSSLIARVVWSVRLHIYVRAPQCDLTSEQAMLFIAIPVGVALLYAGSPALESRRKWKYSYL